LNDKEIQEHIKVAQSKISKKIKKNCADKRRRPLKFLVGDIVFLKVSPIKGLRRFNLQGKLGPRYTSLYEIIER